MPPGAEWKSMGVIGFSTCNCTFQAYFSEDMLMRLSGREGQHELTRKVSWAAE